MGVRSGLGEAMKGLHWKRVTVVSIGAITTVVLSFSVGRSARDYKPIPTILATLAGDEKGFNSGIDARVRELFPTGSSEDDLIDYLDAEGFVPDWPRRNGHNAGRFVHDGILCTKIVRVLWRSDDRGKLTNVGGGYESRCLTDPPAR
jgi:hypothetical protein